VVSAGADETCDIARLGLELNLRDKRKIINPRIRSARIIIKIINNNENPLPFFIVPDDGAGVLFEEADLSSIVDSDFSALLSVCVIPVVSSIPVVVPAGEADVSVGLAVSVVESADTGVVGVVDVVCVAAFEADGDVVEAGVAAGVVPVVVDGVDGVVDVVCVVVFEADGDVVEAGVAAGVVPVVVDGVVGVVDVVCVVVFEADGDVVEAGLVAGVVPVVVDGVVGVVDGAVVEAGVAAGVVPVVVDGVVEVVDVDGVVVVVCGLAAVEGVAETAEVSASAGGCDAKGVRPEEGRLERD